MDVKGSAVIQLCLKNNLGVEQRFAKTMFLKNLNVFLKKISRIFSALIQYLGKSIVFLYNISGYMHI